MDQQSYQILLAYLSTRLYFPCGKVNNLLSQIHSRYLFESCKLLQGAKLPNNPKHQLFSLLEEIKYLLPFFL